MADLPTPDDIFEELADKTASQIDRLAPVAFDKALKEMLRYHRFLLALNASRTPDGAAFNYAELTGDAWSPPYRTWIGQYSRMFERAMDRLPDEAHFMRSLSHVPGALLPRPGDPELSANVVSGLLDIAVIMIHRIEAWVTKRTIVTIQEGHAAEPRLELAGSDAKVYANVLHDVVGAWESTLQQAPSIYRWPERGNQDDAANWASYSASWPFLWQHLSNTAHCLAAAVWNEDEKASTLYCQSLVRWRSSLSYRIEDSIELRWRRLLFPDILQLNWSEARTRALRLAYDYLPAPTPRQLFSELLDGAYQDVVLLTAALLLSWTMQKKQATEIGGRNALGLLRGEGGEEHDSRTIRQRGFRSLFFDLLRLELAGERFRDGTYASQLDELVRQLDNMTERRVVPGRIFSSSTLQGRDDLLQSFVTILAAYTPNEGDETFLERVADLAREEDVLPAGDRSLRNIVHQLDSISSILERAPSPLDRGVSLLAPGRDLGVAVAHFRGIVAAAKATVVDQRLGRLKARRVDADRLEQVRRAIETALLDDPAEISFFRDVRIARAPSETTADVKEISFNGIPKAQFTNPPMEAVSTHFEQQFVAISKERCGRFAWNAFCGRARIPINLQLKPTDEAFWVEIAPLLRQIGTNAVLVLAKAESEAIRRVMRASRTDRGPLKIERRPYRGDFYIGTIEGIDVFSSAFPAGTAWLFSESALNKILYGKVEAPDRYVVVTYDPGEQLATTLKVSVRPKFEWTEAPIFEICFIDKADAPAND
jgi:hypothetical protein